MAEVMIGTTIFPNTPGGIISSWPEDKKYFYRIIRPDGETWIGSESRYRESLGMVVWVDRPLLSGEGVMITGLKDSCASAVIVAPRKIKVKKCKEEGCDGEICEEGLPIAVNSISMKIYPCRKCGRAYSKSGKPVLGKGGVRIFLKEGNVIYEEVKR